MNERRLDVFRSERGMALVLTLMIVVLIVALVTEFSYDVFTTTSALNNWKESQRLSLIAKSGVTLAVKMISQIPNTLEMNKYLGKEIPVEQIVEGFEGRVIFTVEDENSRFNLNSLVTQNQQLNDRAYQLFKNLLKNIGLNEAVADSVVNWIRNDAVPMGRSGDSQTRTKNALMDSVDELLLIKGIDRETYEKMLPYVTVHGTSPEGSYRADSFLVNINTATIPVIMSLNKEKMTSEIAERITRYRTVEPFTMTGDLVKAGVDPNLATSLAGFLVFRPSNFHIRVVAEENKIRRVIECVVTTRGTILYWKEI